MVKREKRLQKGIDSLEEQKKIHEEKHIEKHRDFHMFFSLRQYIKFE